MSEFHNKRTSPSLSPGPFGFEIHFRTRRFFDQFANRPDMVFDSARHCWRFRLKRHVNSAEVVEREPERQRTLMVLPFLAETVRQSRELSR